jgi:dipicolinate synthase subunit B
MCGSYCAFERALGALEKLRTVFARIIPIMSERAYSQDTRFGRASDFAARVSALCGEDIIHDIRGAEPIGPRGLLDILIIAPCTGNTLAKLALGITDSSVTMAAKAHLRNGRPVLIAVSTNDALAANLANIGTLLNRKNIYFVPFYQDDSAGKPTSLAADFDAIQSAAVSALVGKQTQPILCADATRDAARNFEF